MTGKKPGASSGKKRSLFKKEEAALHIMALPVVLYLLLFAYIPMIGVLIAFQNYNVQQGFFNSPFVGFQNFRFLFATTDAFIITRNTVLYHLAYLITGLALSLLAALIISSLRSKRAGKFLQSLYMMPHFISWTAVSIAVFALLSPNGPVSRILGIVNITPFSNNWYMTKSFWPPFLILMNAWKSVGYSTVLYLAVISGISSDYYEAAVIDGANKLQQALYITIPHLKFIVIIRLIMSMGTIVRGDFGLHFTVTNNTGYIFSVTDIIDTYIYRGLMKMSNIGMSTAAGLYQSAVGLVMILFSNWLVNKVDADSAMF